MKLDRRRRPHPVLGAPEHRDPPALLVLPQRLAVREEAAAAVADVAAGVDHGRGDRGELNWIFAFRYTMRVGAPRGPSSSPALVVSWTSQE